MTGILYNLECETYGGDECVSTAYLGVNRVPLAFMPIVTTRGEKWCRNVFTSTKIPPHPDTTNDKSSPLVTEFSTTQLTTVASDKGVSPNSSCVLSI